MKGQQKMESKKLLVILPIVLALVLLANVTSVKAQEDLFPRWDYITLFQSQSATVSTSQITPIGSHFVWVNSIGNRSLGASVTGISPGTTGFWTILLLGTGTTAPVDIAGGVVPWSSGQRAQIDLNPTFEWNLGIVITTLYLIAAEDNVGYTISIGQ
jgi:hypothetical protein